ncbi:phage tail protein [Chloroflexota bacterium]
MSKRNLILGTVLALILVALCVMPAYAVRRRPPINEDYVGNYNFTVEIDGITVGQFTAVDGLNIEQEVIEYQNGDDPLLRKRPGRISYGNITLTRQYAANSTLNDWIEAARFSDGQYQRKIVSIVLADQQDNILKRWNCFECFPVSWELTTLEGEPGDTLYEQLVVAMEWFEEAGGLGDAISNGL